MEVFPPFRRRVYVKINAYRTSLYAGHNAIYANKKPGGLSSLKALPSGFFHPPLTGGMRAIVSPDVKGVFSFAYISFMATIAVSMD